MTDTRSSGKCPILFASLLQCAQDMELSHLVDCVDRHWPIGLLYDCHTVSLLASSSSQAIPLRMTLHLASPPVDKLLLSPSSEACKQAFMGQLKEADFLRWGNTKRVTGLRKAEQDGIWEGIKDREWVMLVWPARALSIRFFHQTILKITGVLHPKYVRLAHLRCTRRARPQLHHNNILPLPNRHFSRVRHPMTHLELLELRTTRIACAAFLCEYISLMDLYYKTSSPLRARKVRK